MKLLRSVINRCLIVHWVNSAEQNEKQLTWIEEINKIDWKKNIWSLRPRKKMTIHVVKKMVIYGIYQSTFSFSLTKRVKICRKDSRGTDNHSAFSSWLQRDRRIWMPMERQAQILYLISSNLHFTRSDNNHSLERKRFKHNDYITSVSDSRGE